MTGSVFLKAPAPNRAFKRLTYSEVLAKFKFLTTNDSHNIFRLEFGEKLYKDFPKTACKVDSGAKDEPCQYPILKITNWDQPLEKIRKLPQVLLMAGIHGNETVGTYALAELAGYIQNHHNGFKHLINSRMIIIIPFVNPQGFSHTQREETQLETKKSFDPNRDFPYDNTDCFNTSTGRFLDQIFRTHLIVNTFIFHGGTTVLAYPWGNYPHEKDLAPDNVSFKQVGEYLRREASSNKAHPNWVVKPYKTGDMTHTVYAVKGGLEDWAYGGWDKPNVPKCHIKTSPQYRFVGTPYKPAMLKAFIYLVEASDDKSPQNVTMGSVKDVSKPGGESDGHISRNVRMSLDFIKATAPYVFVKGLGYNPQTKMASVEYQAGGCFDITETQVTVTSCDKKSGLRGVCLAKNAKLNGNKVGKLSDETKSVVATWPVSDPKKPFSIKIRLSCDQGWANPPAGTKVQPKSHMVSIRTKTQTQDIQNNGFSLKSYKNVVYEVKDIIVGNLSTVQLDRSNENKMNFIDGASKLVAKSNGLSLTVKQKSAKSLRITLSPQNLKFENSEVFIQMHKAGSEMLSRGNCKFGKFTKSKLKCAFSGYRLIDLLDKDILIKKGSATLFTAKLQKQPIAQVKRALTASGWNRRRVLTSLDKRNRNLAAVSEINQNRNAQTKTPTKNSPFVPETISRLNNLTYGYSCIIAACVSLFIVICMLIYLRNALVKLVDIYRQDKDTQIIAIDRKADFDSMSSLSGGTDDKGKVLSADFGENKSMDNISLTDSAHKNLTDTVNA